MRYAYVFNNPMKLVDPTGHEPTLPIMVPGERAFGGSTTSEHHRNLFRLNLSTTASTLVAAPPLVAGGMATGSGGAFIAGRTYQFAILNAPALNNLAITAANILEPSGAGVGAGVGLSGAGAMSYSLAKSAGTAERAVAPHVGELLDVVRRWGTPEAKAAIKAVEKGDLLVIIIPESEIIGRTDAISKALQASGGGFVSKANIAYIVDRGQDILEMAATMCHESCHFMQQAGKYVSKGTPPLSEEAQKKLYNFIEYEARAMYFELKAQGKFQGTYEDFRFIFDQSPVYQGYHDLWQQIFGRSP